MTKPLDFLVAVAQMRSEPGNIRKNLADMLEKIDQARNHFVPMIVFPELALTGYLLGDRWEHDAFMLEVAEANEVIRSASTGMVVIWGSVFSDLEKIGEDGRLRKYNAAFIAQDGQWVSNGILNGWVPKANLPKYRIFDDERHFYPAGKLAEEMHVPVSTLVQPFPVNIWNGMYRLGISVCEDLWEDEYATKISRIHKANRADLIIDISCSPWTAGKWQARERMLRNRVKDSGLPILYVNTVGLQNNGKNLVWFDGDSCFIHANGTIGLRSGQHDDNMWITRLSQSADDREHSYKRPSEIEEIHGAIIAAKREFFASIPRVVIGLSGGIDSAVSAALLVEALGPDRVTAINMPTQYNSATTQDLAAQCARNLGIRDYRVVPIQHLYDVHLGMLFNLGIRDPSMLVKENIQARIRGSSVLAAVAQALNGRFVCNGNKTEIAFNYFTLYGDGAGVAAFLGDLWKGQIYEMARFINGRAGRELIPQGIIDIVPSAELSADQNVDEGKGDPIFYPYHDRLAQAFIEKRWDPTVILERFLAGTLEHDLGCEPGTIEQFMKVKGLDVQGFVGDLERWWKQYCYEGKRVQLMPTMNASRRGMGYDRRDTIADAYFTERYARLKKQLCLVDA